MTPSPPGVVSFRVICPELGKISDTNFNTDSLISTVLTCLKAVFHLEQDNFYLKQQGRRLEPGDTVGETVPSGSTCLLLSGEESQLDGNLDLALLHCPEGFVNNSKKILTKVKVNGHEMNGFLDSGAMHSILTPENVAGCGLQELVDSRFCDSTAGVGGVEKSQGKIMYCPVTIGSVPTPISLLVMDGPAALFDKGEVLLGMDFIQKYVKWIDFEEGKIHLKNGTTMDCL